MKEAIKVVSSRTKGGAMPIGAEFCDQQGKITTVRKEVEKKHPHGQPADPDALVSLSGTGPAVHPGNVRLH